MQDLIKAALFTPTVKGWGLPLFFWGPPGVAKTDIIESVTSRYGMYLKVLSPGESGEGAFGVTPVPRESPSGKVYMTYPEPDWLLELEQTDGRAVVFIDEATHAPRSVQPAILGLIQARRIGGAPLGSLCRVVAAGNPPNAGSGGFELTDAQANRLCHINWIPPDVDSWVNWLWSAGALKANNGTQSDAEAEELRVLRAWPDAFNEARTIVSGFVRFKHGALYERPSSDSPHLYRAWASHRTWYLCAVALASSIVHNLDHEDEGMLIGGCVGDAARVGLNAYRLSTSLPKVESILDGSVEFKHDESRLDITYTVLASCANMVSNPACKNRSKRATVLWSILDEIISDGVEDIAVMCAKTLVRSSPNEDGSRIVESRPAQRVLEKLKPLLEAAGYGK